jgi:hypothetical protein
MASVRSPIPFSVTNLAALAIKRVTFHIHGAALPKRVFLNQFAVILTSKTQRMCCRGYIRTIDNMQGK